MSELTMPSCSTTCICDQCPDPGSQCETLDFAPESGPNGDCTLCELMMR